MLVNSKGQSCLSDFGIARVISDQTLWHTSTSKAPGSTRWQAPELLDGTQNVVTVETDVFSWARTVLVLVEFPHGATHLKKEQEILSGEIPFHTLRLEAAVILAVVYEKQLPSVPEHVVIENLQWRFLTRCWDYTVESRPSTTDLVRSVYSTFAFC